MPRLTGDLNETWHLLASNYDRWEVTAGVTINVAAGGNGIEDDASGSDIIVDGTVIARPAANINNFAGVYAQDSASSVTIGQSGHIDSALVKYGVAAVVNGIDVTNHGAIEAIHAGIYGRKGVDIENYGAIRAQYALELEFGNFNIHNAGTLVGSTIGVVGRAGDFSILVNDAGGKIEGGGNGIYIVQGDPGESAKIVNEGLIRGGEYALFCSDATLEIVNSGTMVGDVFTGAGNDVINTRDGIIRGVLRGGNGNDTYIIGRSKVSIVEQEAGENNDFVQSTVTYRLTDNVEGLQLVGRKNINATGNDGANTLTGNVGDNKLSGGDGADALYSIQGDDRMTGGTGGDVFVFGKDYDRDRITDFEDGVDQLWLLGVTDQQQFDALNIRQSGDDLIINYGRGDQLIIEDLRKQDLTLDDLFIA